MIAAALILIGPAQAAQVANSERDLSAAAQSQGVLDRAESHEPLAVAAVAAGLLLIGVTLSGVVWRRRAVVLPVLTVQPIPRTPSGWQVGATEVRLPESPALEGSVRLDPTG